MTIVNDAQRLAGDASVLASNAKSLADAIAAEPAIAPVPTSTAAQDLTSDELVRRIEADLTELRGRIDWSPDVGSAGVAVMARPLEAIASTGELVPAPPAPWTDDSAISPGTVIRVGGTLFKSYDGGVTGDGLPDFTTAPDVDQTVIDNTVTWTNIGPA